MTAGTLEALRAPLRASGAMADTRGPRSPRGRLAPSGRPPLAPALPSGAAPMRPDETDPLGNEAPTPFLTITELQVLDRLADGLTRAQTASRMHMAAETVSTHLQRIRRKIGYSTQAGMVGYAYRNGLFVRRPLPSVPVSLRASQVLWLLADGLLNQEIGDEMGLRIDTVKTHLAGAMRALGAQSRAHAVRRAVDVGVLPMALLALKGGAS